MKFASAAIIFIAMVIFIGANNDLLLQSAFIQSDQDLRATRRGEYWPPKLSSYSAGQRSIDEGIGSSTHVYGQLRVFVEIIVHKIAC